jgi:hypothetical protein
MQVDGAAKARRPDPSKAAGPTCLPMPPAPEAGAITHPVPRGNPRTGRINPFPFLRMTEPAGGTAANAGEPWVDAALTWRALHRKHEATTAPGDGIRRAGARIDSTPGARHGDMERDARRC